MKQQLALLLAAVLPLALTGCTGTGQGAATPSQPTPPALTAPAAEASPAPQALPGTYRSATILHEDVYELHENGTYDRTGTYDDLYAKGTYVENESGGFSLTEADFEDYGLPPSFDSSGRSAQTFVADYLVGRTTKMVSLTLDKDGSFVLKDFLRGDGSAEELTEVAGVYNLEGALLTLECQDGPIPMIVQDGGIYFFVLEKQ